MNKFLCSGNLTRSPELKYSATGKAYTKFTVAVQRPFDKDNTDFFNCTCFGKQAENVAQYCDKGSKVLCEGQVNIDNKDDKYYTNILVDRVEFIGVKSKSEGNTASGSYTRSGFTPNKETQPTKEQMAQGDPFAFSPIDISDDDLPF